MTEPPSPNPAKAKNPQDSSGLTAPATKVAHRSETERAKFGRAARSRASLDGQAELRIEGRADPLALLATQAASRVPDLVPIRYGRMVSSPFAFYRGAALLMASDLATTENSGLHVQLCGDAHLSNFGVFASPERRLVFDINDFDETHPGPFEWDVKRLAASLAVAGRANGFSAKKRRAVVTGCVSAYRQAMRSFATQGNMTVWYSSLDMDEFMTQISRQAGARRTAKAQAVLDKARSRDSVQALSKLTRLVDGQHRIISQPPLVVPIEELVSEDAAAATYDALRLLIRSYRRTLQWDRRHLLEQFKLTQVARKVVGVGSVGTRAWILLFEGLNGGDPLFLQAKEAQPSVLSGFTKPSGFKNQGQRVVTGQQLMQASSDVFLGWQHVSGIDGVPRDFYLRQLRDGKGSAVIEEMRPDALTLYGRICGQTRARAHARSGDRVAIAAYLGGRDRFDNAIADFAEAYADLNERDHSALTDAISAGRVEAQLGI
jgi:uncharacterized protein (DUF2252 family)